MAQPPLIDGTWARVDACDLTVCTWHWPLAAERRQAIDADWRARKAQTPGLFNGAVYLFRDFAIAGGRLTGTLFRSDFKTLLYWRSLDGKAAGSVKEASGASLIRAADRHLLYGRQAPNQLNSGLVYPPSGVIDGSDVFGEVVDIDAHIARELEEETGLTAADLQRVPGYVVALDGRHVAIGVEWRSAQPAETARRSIMGFLGAQTEPELDDIVIVRAPAAIAEHKMPPHARIFARALLSAGTSES